MRLPCISTPVQQADHFLENFVGAGWLYQMRQRQ